MILIIWDVNMNKNFAKFFLIFFMMVLHLGVQGYQPLTVAEISVHYQPTLELFNELQAADSATKNIMIPQFFLQQHMQYQDVIEQIRHDLGRLRSEIKRLRTQNASSEQKKQAQDLQKKLHKLYQFFRRHRLQYNAIVFEQEIIKKWRALFDAVAQGSDIEPLLSQAGITEAGRQGLKTLSKQIEQDLRKIEYYEYRLHADWIDAKLANYVAKIELIRLRNAALFHPLYKKTQLKLFSSYPR
jgi:hypothetical protein